MLEIKTIPKTRWKEYKALRLEALKKEPLSFARTYEEERDYSEKKWKERIKNTLFALENNELAGIVSFRQCELIKMSHIAEIVGLYVKEEYRGKKIGSKLLEAAINKIKTNKKIEKIRLITDPSLKAQKLYKKFGFEKVVILKKELKYKGKYHDDLIMEKLL